MSSSDLDAQALVSVGWLSHTSKKRKKLCLNRYNWLIAFWSEPNMVHIVTGMYLNLDGYQMKSRNGEKLNN